MRLLLLVLLALPMCMSAQDRRTPFVWGETHTFRSATLNEDRTINVWLPSGYDTGTTRLPVIYLLDGSANEDFMHVAGLMQFMSGITGAIKPAIVVGIANVNRKRDFTLPAIDEENKKIIPQSGGSIAFINFLQNDLIPYVTTHYRTATSTLIGQSLGGLLATQVLVERPQLFDTYIIVSPSLWWNNESLLHSADEGFKAHTNTQTRVYLASGGKEPKVMQQDAATLAKMVKKYRNMQLTYAPEPTEDHATILHNCLYHAFGVLYK